MSARSTRIDSEGRTQRALLEAAEELFAAHGYAAVGIRELVARAGVNLSAVKYHFGSKHDLYVETVRGVMNRRETGEIWDELAATPSDPEEAIRALVRFVHALIELHGGREELSSCIRLVLHEAMQPTAALDDVVASFTQPNLEALARLLAVLRPGTPADVLELDARSVMGQVFHYLVLRPVVERGASVCLREPDVARRVADHVASFSLRALGIEEDRIQRALCELDVERKSASRAARTGLGPSELEGTTE